jgi:hypothetical protein
MAEKDENGKWTFTPEEEGQIELLSEARYRTIKRLKKEEAEEKEAAEKKAKEDAAAAGGKKKSFKIYGGG